MRQSDANSIEKYGLDKAIPKLKIWVLLISTISSTANKDKNYLKKIKNYIKGNIYK
jgi:hypothetical protein